MGGKLMYSTETGSHQKKESKGKSKKYDVSEGPVKIRLEKKGRAGKCVTVLFNLPFEKAEARRHMKEIQKLLGIGATLKGAQIEFQGDVFEKVAEYFQCCGVKVVRSGG